MPSAAPHVSLFPWPQWVFRIGGTQRHKLFLSIDFPFPLARCHWPKFENVRVDTAVTEAPNQWVHMFCHHLAVPKICFSFFWVSQSSDTLVGTLDTCLTRCLIHYAVRHTSANLADYAIFLCQVQFRSSVGGESEQGNAFNTTTTMSIVVFRNP